VIEDAKNPVSPLHSEFEWDIDKAAMEAWRETARRLIRSVTVVVNTESKAFNAVGYRAPEFVRNPTLSNRDQGYARIHDLRSEKDRARSVLMYEIDRINGALTRARAICAELALESEFNIVEDAVKALRKRSSGAA
jgi:hypothetical protein